MQTRKNHGRAQNPKPKHEQKQTTSLQVFNNPEFGDVRVQLNENGDPLFCLSDLCNVLGLTNASVTKRRLRQKGVSTTYPLTPGGVQPMIFVDEPNLYRCIFQSRKPDAEKFQDWVFEEVLPSIRKTGKYLMPPTGNRVVQIASNISMNVIPSERHEFLVTTKEFARAINISENTIRTNKSRGNFKEDIHFIDNYDVYDDDEKLEVRCTVWTKKGVIEHATFIRTGYGKELRNWVGNQNGSALVVAGKPIKRNHNRLTHERLLDIMSDVCEIENKELRLRISTKLTGGV